jgi:hypothetical protein
MAWHKVSFVGVTLCNWLGKLALKGTALAWHAQAVCMHANAGANINRTGTGSLPLGLQLAELDKQFQS